MCASITYSYQKKSWAEWTQYPTLFKGYKWGNYSSAEYSDGTFSNRPDVHVIQHRNEFVGTYSITSKCDLKKLPLFNSIYKNFLDKTKYKSVDHVEGYHTQDNKIVIISSPYTESLSSEDIQQYQAKGWVEITNMYFGNTRTFLLSMDHV